MRFLFFLALFPHYLSAGFLSWFYTSPETVKQFDCSYDCGKLGSEGIKQVQWKGIEVLWELDRLNHLVKGETFLGNTIPVSPTDPWVKKTAREGISIALTFEVPKRIKIPCSNYHYFSSSEIGRIEKTKSIWWPTIQQDDEGKIIGYGVDLCSLDFDSSVEGTVLDEVDWSLDSLKEIHDFSATIETVLKGDYGSWFRDHFRSFHEEASSVVEDQNRRQGDITRKIHQVDALLAQGINSHMGVSQKEKRAKLFKALEQSKKEAQVAGEIQQKFEKTRDNIHEGLTIYGPCIRSRLREIGQAYCAIWDDCAAHHHAPAAYYNRALYHYGEGNNMNCIEDIKKLFEMTPSEMITEKMRENLLLRQGKAECELDLFDDAIFTLSKHISAFPRRKEAYLERAIAHFEKGNTAEALKDFIDSGAKIDPIINSPAETMEYGLGVMKGLGLGIAYATQENLLFLMSSPSGLLHGMIALATSPEETSKEFVRSCQEVIGVIKENGLPEIILAIFPEAKELFTNEPIHPSRQGELTGQLIGCFGIDFLLLEGGGKAVSAARNFRSANATLTLERMARSIQVEQQMIHHTQEWWTRTSKLIDELKVSPNRDFGKSLYRTFRDTPLSESQVRKILHRAGYKTFPKPKGLPHDCIVTISHKDGGMVYRKAGSTTEQVLNVRVMPGDPCSPNLRQRKPYVVQRRGDKALSPVGQFVPKNLEEIHIPVEEYTFKGW
ncbi:MAG: tetratricopeptide repeat protein [Chlamydiales bacterium]|nr:tetratricopeptide repeat protein [Chlamydiales bacterium]